MDIQIISLLTFLYLNLSPCEVYNKAHTEEPMFMWKFIIYSSPNKQSLLIHIGFNEKWLTSKQQYCCFDFNAHQYHSIEANKDHIVA